MVKLAMPTGVYLRKPLAARLAALTKRDEATGCLLFIGALNDAGYGVIKDNGKRRRASRVAWELVNGPLPEGLDACHTCDTPACVEVEHLFPGTHLDNMKDRDEKGRTPKGEANGASKLTAEQVSAILLDSDSLRLIALKHNVTKGTVWKVKQRHIWV